LKDCLCSLFGWQVKVVTEIKPLPKPLNSITSDPGIYAFYDHNFELLYVGQAENLASEVSQGGVLNFVLTEFLVLRHPFIELDSKPVKRRFPVSNGHCPFLADVLYGQVEQF